MKGCVTGYSEECAGMCGFIMASAIIHPSCIGNCLVLKAHTVCIFFSLVLVVGVVV